MQVTEPKFKVGDMVRYVPRFNPNWGNDAKYVFVDRVGIVQYSKRTESSTSAWTYGIVFPPTVGVFVCGEVNLDLVEVVVEHE